MGNKLAIAAAAVLLLALGGLAAYWLVGDADLKRPAAGRPATAVTGEPAASATLSPADMGSIQVDLDRLQATEQVRAALSGGVDRPWQLERSTQAFRSCMERLPGTGLFDGETPAAQERVCACVTRRLQQGFPGAPPTGPKAGRKAGRAELEAIEGCIQRAD
jgi:hypothetical protein